MQTLILQITNANIINNNIYYYYYYYYYYLCANIGLPVVRRA